METLQPGEIRTGHISGMRDFGAFVDLGGADGLVHISELSWHRIDHPREVVKLGDEVEVYVLGVDQESGRISLSRKKLLPNPWDTVAQRYVQNQLVEGKITRILDYGAFAEIEPGVEGLLHVSQLSRNPVEDPRAVVQEGEVHLLRVVSIDQKRQRVGLSLKAVTPTEQIEWMAQKELAEALRIEEEEATTAARGPARRADNETGESAVEEVEEMADVVEDTAEVVDETADEAADTLDATVEEVEEAAEAAGETVEEAINATPDIVESAEEEAEEAADDVTEAADNAVETAAEENDEVITEVTEPAEETTEAAEGTAQTIGDKIQDAVSDAVDTSEDAVENVIEKIESAVDDDGGVVPEADKSEAA